MCAVPGGKTSNHAVADILRSALGERADELPPTILRSAYPFEVLRFAALLGPHELDAIEARLTEAEVHGVAAAPATHGAGEAITELRDAGHTIMIVGNNSADAVATYLDRHGLLRLIARIVARTSSDPDLFEPDPHLLRQVIGERATTASSCVLIGDSVTDVHAAGMPCIGHANKPRKADALAGAGAQAIVTTMTDIAETAEPSRRTSPGTPSTTPRHSCAVPMSPLFAGESVS